MKITYANYIASFPDVRKCPEPKKPEYAFIGRSNVGKSSLINYLTGKKKLAKTSGQPGKTQMINYFEINNSWYLVDLPGYGYAKVSKTKRREFRKMIEDYMLKRKSLMCSFILIDANVSPQEVDLEFINWCGGMQIPFVICYTKMDKSKEAEVEANIAAFREKMLEEWEEMPREFMTSANNKVGAKEILKMIREVNEEVGVKYKPL